jgi:hypothetical protein
VLEQLCRALSKYDLFAALLIATGEPDAIEQVALLVVPHSVDPETSALTYRPHSVRGCPTVMIPWRRIIALHDAS